jgi:N-methylhydantoinase A/oxoprolinase/acetone carboxylase beta subunit
VAEDIVTVDVGGTFTDICVLRRDTGELRVAKVPSTANPIDGVMTGVETAGIDLSKVALFSHRTTVATNALITRTYPSAAMVTTKGFRDVIEIRRGTKEDLWDRTRTSPRLRSAAGTASRSPSGSTTPAKSCSRSTKTAPARSRGC